QGCDGGSIPTRIELVKTKKKEERADPAAKARQAWFYCALSKELLASPVVVDALGRLYNKEAIIRFLLDRKGAFGDGETLCSHIESLKDLVDLKLSDNPAFSSASSSSSSSAALTAGTKGDEVLVPRWICPITMREMNGKYGFVYLQTCGHVFSDQAFKQVPSTTCLVCSKPFVANDVVPINSTRPEDIERLQARMQDIKREREQREREKKEKKRREKEAKRGTKETAKDSAEDSGLGTSGGSGSEEEAAAAERRKSGKDKDSKKRKHTQGDDMGMDDDAEDHSKRRATINVRMPKLDAVGQGIQKVKESSDAIKSLYGDGKDKSNISSFYLGTFHR
ncbi:DUF602-domain-containing protein, partial [Gonapodya prolifera JEL478]